MAIRQLTACPFHISLHTTFSGRGVCGWGELSSIQEIPWTGNILDFSFVELTIPALVVKSPFSTVTAMRQGTMYFCHFQYLVHSLSVLRYIYGGVRGTDGSIAVSRFSWCCRSGVGNSLSWLLCEYQLLTAVENNGRQLEGPQTPGVKQQSEHLTSVSAES